MGQRSMRWYFDLSVAYLIKVKDKIKLADIVEVFIQNLHKIVDRFQVTQIIVIYINADAEVQTSISPVYYFKVAELKW